MIIRKTPREIALLKEAGRIVALVHEELKKHIVSGITTKEIDKLSEKVIRQNGATPSFKGYQGFPGSVCVSINDMVIHGIPDNRKLKDGDIVSVDVGACYQGYHGDSAWTYDISAAIEEYVKQHGYTSPVDYTGHGVGTSIHEDPMVPNYGKSGHGPLLKTGMVIAVEPMVHIGKKDVKVLKDGWGVVTADHSLAAHYEHTIVITEDGYEILTKL